MSFGISEQVHLAAVNYYAREKLWRHVQSSVKFGLKKLGNDPAMHFWNAFSYIPEGRVAEAQRELGQMKDNRDVGLAVVLALIHAHKQSVSVDRDAVKELEGMVKVLIKESGETALQQAALVMLHIGKHDKARDLADKILKLRADSKDALALRGWIDLTSQRDVHVKKSIKYFDEVLKNADENPDSTHLEALMGKIQYLQQVKKDYVGSLDLVSKAVALFPTFLPALIEKAKAQLALLEWDSCSDTLDRCSEIDGQCLQALHLKAIITLAQTGRFEQGSSVLSDLIAALDATEPSNQHAFYTMCQAPARLGGCHSLVLMQTRTMLDRAIKASPQESAYLSEQAMQVLRRDHVREAARIYKQAMSADETSVDALNGVILCQLLLGQLADARQQLDFLQEVQASIGKTPILLYLRALLASKSGDASSGIIELLDEAVALHLASVSDLAPGNDYYIKLAPDFVLDIAKLYLQYAPSEPAVSSDAASPILSKITSLLETLTKTVPGSLEGVFLLAKAKYLAGLTTSAQSSAQYCLKMDSTYSDAHLLMAQIHLTQGNIHSANSSLETGLSYNFNVRDSPLYHVISSKIQAAEGKQTERMRALSTAMALPGVKRTITIQGNKKIKKVIPAGDRVEVFLELAKAHMDAGRAGDAVKIMTEALTEFASTPEESRIVIENAKLAVARGEVETALTELRGVTPDKPYYVQAHETMAKIYLENRKDKLMYAACYKQLVEANPCGHTHLLLGDAYMAIQEPGKAISIYEAALKQDPRNSVLASKIGAAMVRTHDYAKAINYYEAAVKQQDNPRLKVDLAQLYLKLKQPDKADKVLSSALAHEESSDLDVMMQDVKFMQMQATMYADTDQYPQQLSVLNRAKDLQDRVISRVASEQPESLKEQQSIASGICIELARYFEAQGELDSANHAYRDALRHDETSGSAMLELAKLCLKQDSLEPAQFQLSTLLQSKSAVGEDTKDQAALILADIMFRKLEYDQAIFHLQQVLEKKPNDYGALSHMVDLLRRAGKLTDASKYLTRAEANVARTLSDPGFHYCKGLYERFMHHPNEALKSFNRARKDVTWGVRALYNMVEICLFPHVLVYGNDVSKKSDKSDKNDATDLGVRTADKLLQELAGFSQTGQLKFQVLKIYAMIATGQKAQIEQAIQALSGMSTNERDNISIVLATARAYALMRNTPKARTHLKRLASMQWSSEHADDFEGVWLLLADAHISINKFDLAQAELKKALQHNKAWELMGLVMEKEQSYANAAEFYENAWSSSGESDPAVGYKLAFNYLKANRFVDAVDICHVVLGKFPAYPRIQKEILDKARQQLRV